jgi:SAM-dependent methyltransferase
MADKNPLVFVCPDCKKELTFLSSKSFFCDSCNKNYPIINNVVFFLSSDIASDSRISFYESWQKKIDQSLCDSEKYKFVFKRLSENSFYLKVRDFYRENILPFKSLCLLCDYFNKRRNFFFEDFLRGNPRGLVLDLGCARGSELYCRYGEVVGVDLNLGLLTGSSDKADYLFFIHCNALKLPFKDGQFDYLVSSDFIEHVPNKDKSDFYKEAHRVLKEDGQMAHYITTDSINPWFRFAHRYPELFKKYLIDEIGGHYGLELPELLLENIKKHGFRPVMLNKMLWEPGEFYLRFNNEYKKKSYTIKMLVYLMKRLVENEFVSVIINIPVSLVCRIVEFFMPLNYSNKITVVFKKV